MQFIILIESKRIWVFLKKRIEELYGTDRYNDKIRPYCHQNHRNGSYQLTYQTNLLDLLV